MTRTVFQNATAAAALLVLSAGSATVGAQTSSDESARHVYEGCCSDLSACLSGVPPSGADGTDVAADIRGGPSLGSLNQTESLDA